MNLKTEKETLMGSKKTDLMRISYFVAIVILVCLIGNLKDLWLQSWTDLIIYLIVLFAAAECLFSTFARIRAVGEQKQPRWLTSISLLIYGIFFLRNSIFIRRFLNKQVMIKKNLLKGICLLWLLLAVTPVLQAQDRAQQASELLDRLIAGQGDSVYVHLDDNIRKMLSVEMLNGLFKQLEQQAGKYQSHGEWKTEPINGMTVYYCDVKFESLPLRFLTAFNPDGKVNTIRFVPVPAEKDHSPDDIGTR